MTELDNWLRQATRHLAKDAAAQVRTEIQEHYELTRDTAIANGAASEDAEHCAVSALGDAKVANCQYRRVLLTSAEARMLREGNWESHAVCSHPWLKRLFLAVPAAILFAASVLFLMGHVAGAWDAFLCGIGVSPFVAALFLLINNRSRGRVFRYAKWVVMTGAIVLLFGAEAFKWSWLLISCFWPLAWMEWTRASIRRKLPIKAWPRHLYL